MDGRRRRTPAFLYALVMLVALGLLGAGSLMAARRIVERPGPLGASRDVVIPRGGLTEIEDALLRAGVIDRTWAFRLAAWMSWADGPLHALELNFPPAASLQTVLTVLRTGRPVQHLLTVPEGLTSHQIAALVNRAEAMSGQVKPPAEGSVLPETYAYEHGMGRPTLLARAEAAMTRELAVAWENRAPGLPLATMQEALTLASIVERETARPEERPHVASVYFNRLKTGMRLQADPTVVYAASGGDGVLDRKLTRGDLEMVSPYNTYRVAGLPPGPICAPGLASIQAVLHPAISEDLFFVADGTGGHAFSRTQEGHARNVAAWRALSTSGQGRATSD